MPRLEADSPAFDYPELTKDEVLALQAVYAGVADAHQQRLSLVVISKKLCRAHDVLYVPGSFDETSVLVGRGFVGQKILKYLNLPVAQLEDNKDG